MAMVGTLGSVASVTMANGKMEKCMAWASSSGSRGCNTTKESTKMT